MLRNTMFPLRGLRRVLGSPCVALVIAVSTPAALLAQATTPQPSVRPPATIADWLVAAGTLILALVAIFQDTIRSWFYSPQFRFSVRTGPPDCVAVPFSAPDGSVVADAIYLRIWVENIGNATARNVEVYATELRRRRADKTWERVGAFPPMNLKWANLGTLYFPSISAGMGKHCDLAHIADPERRHLLHEDAPALSLTNAQSSLAFDLIALPNHRGHIVGPGEYQLDILVAAENVPPKKGLVSITVRGPWFGDEATMFRDGVGVAVE